MKQMKFLLVALMAVVMGLSVTSCMNGDDNTIVQRTDFVRVVQDFPVYFKNMAGNIAVEFIINFNRFHLNPVQCLS